CNGTFTMPALPPAPAPAYAPPGAPPPAPQYPPPAAGAAARGRVHRPAAARAPSPPGAPPPAAGAPGGRAPPAPRRIHAHLDRLDQPARRAVDRARGAVPGLPAVVLPVGPGLGPGRPG